MRNLRISAVGVGEMIASTDTLVPPFQRSYSWGEKHVRNFLTDLTGAIKRKRDGGGEIYFLGSIVVVERLGSKPTEVVDGQQRLATISILLAAIRDYHWQIGQDEAAKQYDSRFLRAFHAPSGRYLPKLKLNDVDDRCFSEAILEAPAKRAKTKWTLSAHKRLIAAFKLANEYVASLATLGTPRDTVASLYETVEFIRTHMQAIRVQVDDDADAFTIFETLNDRHLNLTVADLLKNFLFQNAGRHLDAVKGNWREMAGALSVIKGKKDRTVDFIRQLWGSMHGLVREKELFRDIKQKVLSESNALELSNSLASQASDYAAVLNPFSEFWDNIGVSARHALDTFNSLRVERLRPLILAILLRFDEKNIEKSLDFLRSAAVRIVVDGGINGTIEEQLFAIAVRVYKTEIRNATRLKASMSFVPVDVVFRAKFATASFSKPGLARFFLQELEDMRKGELDDDRLMNRNQKRVTLEHIMPVARSEREQHWPEYANETGDSLVRRLGNLTLLPYRKNSSLNGLNYDAKRPVYDGYDGCYLTKDIAEKFTTWGAEQIKHRQDELADLALRTWPI